MIGEEKERTPEEQKREAAARAIVAALPGAKVLNYTFGEHGGPDWVDVRFGSDVSVDNRHRFGFFDVDQLGRFVYWLAHREAALLAEYVSESHKRVDEMTARFHACEEVSGKVAEAIAAAKAATYGCEPGSGLAFVLPRAPCAGIAPTSTAMPSKRGSPEG